MEKTQVSDREIYITKIGIGTSPICGHAWGGNEKEAIQTIHAAFDQGINLVDTAPVYGFGRSEEIVGNALAAYGQREKLVISTKVGLQWQDGKVVRNATAQGINQEINDSLVRLQTDYIDIYHVHWPDPLTPVEETALAMKKLLEAGKIRAVGISNFSLKQMHEFLVYCPIHVSQQIYNIFEREIETKFLSYVEEKQITTFAYSPLCRGLLSGNVYNPNTLNKDDRRRHYLKFQQPYLQQYVNAVKELHNFAQDHYGKSVLALAIRWVLDKGHAIALWGVHHASHLDKLSEINGWSLDKEAIHKIDLIIAKTITQPVELGLIPPSLR